MLLRLGFTARSRERTGVVKLLLGGVTGRRSGAAPGGAGCNRKTHRGVAEGDNPDGDAAPRPLERSRERDRVGVGALRISVRSGVGVGPTRLAAFDSALMAAGVANFNLIRLSSVIPPGSEVVSHACAPTFPGGWGDRLYCVYGEMTVDTPGEGAWAGIGWVQDTPSLRGLFVEHEGHSEAEVRSDIQASLESLMASRHGNFGPIAMQVVGATCEQRPVSALVLAAYRSEGWSM